MDSIEGSKTQSGVFVADDFRDNLILDRFDPLFARMRASKLKHMRSQNSEDVITWNVFRSLRQIDPYLWVSRMLSLCFKTPHQNSPNGTTVELWKMIDPPSSLLSEGDEGNSEIDILIENPHWVWFIEAKLNSDISTGTTTRPTRDQILRNIDVGTYYSGVRPFFFSLLYRDKERSKTGLETLKRYQHFEEVRKALPHRVDGLVNLAGVGSLTWNDVASVLSEVALVTSRESERYFATRCNEWMLERGV